MLNSYLRSFLVGLAFAIALLVVALVVAVQIRYDGGVDVIFLFGVGFLAGVIVDCTARIQTAVDSNKNVEEPSPPKS